MGHLLRRAAHHGHQGGGRHAGGGAHLRLTAPLRAGDGGPGGDHLSEAGGDIEGLYHGLVTQAVPGLEGNQHRRQHPAGPRRGGGHDAAHAGVALAGLEGGSDHLPQEGRAQAGARAVQQGPRAAGEAAAGAGGGVVLRHRGLHGRPQGGHLVPGAVPVRTPVPEIVLQHRPPQGLVPGRLQQAGH